MQMACPLYQATQPVILECAARKEFTSEVSRWFMRELYCARMRIGEEGVVVEEPLSVLLDENLSMMTVTESEVEQWVDPVLW